jgi:hypothetical protein
MKKSHVRVLNFQSVGLVGPIMHGIVIFRKSTIRTPIAVKFCVVPHYHELRALERKNLMFGF